MSEHVWLLRAAEDQFLHGHLLSRWITDYIDLEESLAAGSIAQEELAHAATLIELAGLDLAGRDAFVFERPDDQWQPTGLVAYRFQDWPATVLRGFLLASAGVARSQVLGRSAHVALAAAARVMQAEQRLHVLHWERWVEILGRSERTADELRARAALVLPLAADMFGIDAGEPGQAARDIWVESVSGPLLAVGIGVEPLAGGCVPRGPLLGSDLSAILADVRSLRVGADDGVRGLYR